VGGEVGSSVHGSEDDVIQAEDTCRFADVAGHGWIERGAIHQKKTEDGSVEAEDGSRSACADGLRMDKHADKTAEDAGEEVDEQLACAADDLFDEWGAGEVKETPVAAMAMNTKMLMAIIVTMMVEGLGERCWRIC
jgi:hypothetical protein